eukprot:c52529_g1_i1.p1 GENE.c52529_g1_i1~~c52529_g1_i1.p1  ORF type:complete len:514 (+),score=90.06 c52529_g1_i1:35-1576(+)
MRSHFVVLTLLLASSVVHARVVCTVAASGFNMKLDANDDLTALIHEGEVFPQDAGLFGFDVDLRGLILKELMGLQFDTVVHATFDRAIYETRIGNCDMTFAPITITAQRESCNNCPDLNGTDFESSACCIDFALPHLQSSLALITRRVDFKAGPSYFAHLLTQPKLINAVISMVALILFSAHLIWVIERRHNPKEFPLTYFDGVVGGMWWAVVTVTTVGYGDKSPRTQLGRVFACIYMFMGIIIVGIFVASIAAALTQQAIEIQQEVDIQSTHGHTVCTIANYRSHFTGQPVTLLFETEDIMNNCMLRLDAGTADFVFLDSILVERWIAEHPTRQNKFLMSNGLADVTYGAAFPEESPLRFEFNLALIQANNFNNTRRVEIYDEWFSVAPLYALFADQYAWRAGIFVAIYFWVMAAAYLIKNRGLKSSGLKAPCCPGAYYKEVHRRLSVDGRDEVLKVPVQTKSFQDIQIDALEEKNKVYTVSAGVARKILELQQQINELVASTNTVATELNQ